jgi:hypothetical protein
MSADLPRVVVVQWTDAQGEENELVTAVHGHADFVLAEWAEAFKAQHRNTLRQIGQTYDLSVYIELDLG